jgi:hypothetical protein
MKRTTKTLFLLGTLAVTLTLTGTRPVGAVLSPPQIVTTNLFLPFTGSALANGEWIQWTGSYPIRARFPVLSVDRLGGVLPLSFSVDVAANGTVVNMPSVQVRLVEVG